MYFQHNKKYRFIKIIAKAGVRFISTLRFVPGQHELVKMEIVELTSTNESLVPRVGETRKMVPGFVFHDKDGGEWHHLNFEPEYIKGTIYEANVRNHPEVKHEDSDKLGMIHLVELDTYLEHIRRSAYPGIDDTTVGNHLQKFHDQLLSLASTAAH